MKKLVLYAMVVAGLSIFNACQKSNELIDQSIDVQQQEAVKPDVYSKNGFLIFSNQKSMEETLNTLEGMSEEERRFWEKEHNFTSQMSMFHDIIIAELKLDEPYENLSEEELKNVELPPLHSDVYYNSLQKGFIKKIHYSDGTELYDYSTCAPFLTSILNEDGIFVIGDTMYQFTQNATKTWSGCEINNKIKLISTNSSIDNITLSINLKSATVKYGSWEYDSERKRRIQIGINFNSSQYSADMKIWRYEHWVEVISQKKNWLGNWKYNWTDMYIKGNWDYEIEYLYPGNINFNYFSRNVGFADYPNTHHVYASNYKSTCSIEYGSISPYGSIINIWHYNDTGDELCQIYDVELTDFSWEVTGHAYVKATVDK
jgi:hypothetical protein